MAEKIETRNIQDFNVDAVFQSQFTSDDCMTALCRAQAQFSPYFPGWALYRRVLIGDTLLDRPLEAYAIGMARAVARATKVNGRQEVSRAARKPGWIAQAGRDGLDFALFGRFAEGIDARCKRFDVSNKPYQRIRDAVADGLWVGVATFQTVVHHEYLRIKRGRKYLEPDYMG